MQGRDRISCPVFFLPLTQVLTCSVFMGMVTMAHEHGVGPKGGVLSRDTTCRMKKKVYI